MVLAVCVDDKLGMAFNRRRQSRDRLVCEDLVKLAAGSPIWMDARSQKLFDGMDADIRTDADFTGCAQGDSFCFVELQPVTDLAEKARKIVLYRWNRHYPADLYFDIPLNGWQLMETTEFIGKSHEKITREVYVHGKE